MVYTTDNDNEYPGWREAKECFYHLNFPVHPIPTAPPKAEQEPVAYCYVQKSTSVDILTFDNEPDDAVDGTIFPLYAAPPEPVAQNFCSRCGKRTPDLTTIHTCTPPRGLEMT
jgi:hypothetical protein